MFENRWDKLRQYQLINATERNLTEADIADYQNLLCPPGYTGNLCASCEQGFGAQGDYECALCPEAHLNHFYYMMQCLITVVMVSLTVRTQLKGIDEIPEDKQIDEETALRLEMTSSTGTKKRFTRGTHSTVIKILVSYLQVRRISDRNL
ncbi:unnamed protein product [Ostreobium quekettii]|uniref:Tyrosine-protein kinase ephrin type A/B receptor-like domain-containing protein n=1 Tax=Ostreobium quekettii TaxID=121088 RepID=A0A8S1ILC9_9CHLO|nr:unnamed protein product [Ostreobium quekettii]|eukprot:evm.model.scf_49.10 EVM.evm.TU.scf_49.10   scf_49:114766-115738(+)